MMLRRRVTSSLSSSTLAIVSSRSRCFNVAHATGAAATSPFHFATARRFVADAATPRNGHDERTITINNGNNENDDAGGLVDAATPAQRRGSNFFSFDDESADAARLSSISAESEFFDFSSASSNNIIINSHSSSVSVSKNKSGHEEGQGDVAAASQDENDNGDDDLILDGGARSILLQELDEQVNIPLTDRILGVARGWIGSHSSSNSSGSLLSDGSLLQRSSFSTATAHLTRSGVLRIHYPLVVRNPARDLLPLCRAVARLHGAALRQDSECRELKLQQTGMPLLAEYLRKHQPSSSPSSSSSPFEFVLVSSADLVEEKIGVVTVLAFDGNSTDMLKPGTELVYTTVALRLFWSPKNRNWVVPEPKLPVGN